MSGDGGEDSQAALSSPGEEAVPSRPAEHAGRASRREHVAPGLTLDAAEVIAYERFADKAGGIACSRMFNDWCDGLLRPFIPFERMVCCLGRVKVGGFVVDGVQSIDWPASSVPESNAVLALPSGGSLDRWFASGEPQWLAGMLSADHAVTSSYAVDPFEWRPASTASSVLVYGIRTSGGQPSSCFGLHLADSTSYSTRLLLKVRMVAPYLHQALVAVSWHRSLGRSSLATAAALSPRELEILHWMVAGKTNAEIAAIVHRSKATIKNQVSSLIAKLDVTNRSQAVGIAHEMGLVERRPRRE